LVDRKIILDTETTGVSFYKDKIVEIACIELINDIKTENFLHLYINPEIDVPEEAVRVHGLNNDFLQDKPKFIEILDEFLSFIKDSKIIAHNSNFDMNMINAELKRLNKDAIPQSIYIDTLEIARKKFPGKKNSLDALCERYNISLSSREKHGALIDIELLYLVYKNLINFEQKEIFNDNKKSLYSKNEKNDTIDYYFYNSSSFELRNYLLSDDKIKEHSTYIEKEIKNSLWNIKGE